MGYAERSKARKLTGRWKADVLFDDGTGISKRLHKAFPSKAECDAAEAYFRVTGNLPPHMLDTPSGSFAGVVERFKERHPEWMAHYTNKQRLQTVVDYFGPMDVAHIRLTQMEEFVTHLRKRAGRYSKPPANRTLLRYIDVVMNVLKYAHRLELIKGLPARPEIADTGATREALTWGQERAIIAHMEAAGHHADAFYVRVLSATGMRCGELDGLTAAQIEVPEQREYTGVYLRKEQTKTNRARWVPIVPEIARKLKAMLAEGSLPDRAHTYETFKRAVVSAGDGQDFTLHCLRHTTVTRLNETGASTLDVAEIVGHSTGLMTQGYNHAHRAHLFSVAEKVQIQAGDEAPSAAVVPLISNRKSA